MPSAKRMLAVAVLVTAGIAARCWFATWPTNEDLHNALQLVQLIHEGQSIYSFEHYNYAPTWAWCLYGLSYLPWNLRWSICGVLTLADLSIALMLWGVYGNIPALLFWFNPVSILITGQHGQFDNVAIAVGLMGILLSGIGGLVLIGLSLTIKHVLIFLPLWLAMKRQEDTPLGDLWVLSCLMIPYVIFVISFAPYWTTHSQDIWRNVVEYRSLNNGIFWLTFLPGEAVHLIPLIALFTGAMVVVGLLVRHLTILDTFWAYLVYVVVFSSAHANQYWVIPMAALCAQWNRWSFAYMLVAGMYLCASPEGLSLPILQHYWPAIDDSACAWMCLMLLLLLLQREMVRLTWRPVPRIH